MPDSCKWNILGVLINATDYDRSVDAIAEAARKRAPFTVSALAVHGLMTGVFDREQQFRLNHFDLLVPDGQPVRWALNWLYNAKLEDRVYGPKLTLKVCSRAEKDGLPVFFYGGTPEVLSSLRKSLLQRFPDLIIAGMAASKFRRLETREKAELAQSILSSDAALTFVGLGCPRQEAFSYEFREMLCMPILAVGAAFPFLAGIIPQAPSWMQNAGLEWLFRLMSEPQRLWRRYLFLNPVYILLVLLQALGVSKFSTEGRRPTRELLYG